MVCETPKNCMGSTYETAPPLQHGYSDVDSYAAPEDLALSQSNSGKVRMLRVPVMTGEDGSGSASGKMRHIELPLVTPAVFW